MQWSVLRRLNNPIAQLLLTLTVNMIMYQVAGDNKQGGILASVLSVAMGDFSGIFDCWPFLANEYDNSPKRF